MSDLNNLMSPTRLSFTKVNKQFDSGELYVDNNFQRRLVWTETQKIRLIETILMGYPMPEIYIWKQPTDSISGDERYSIVDGQQRLTAVKQYISGEFKLIRKVLDKQNQGESYADKKWDELEEAERTKIWDYEVNVRTIPVEISEPQIHSIFARLNETDKSLNPQEKRNAVFHGEFIKAAVTVANELNRRDWNVFNDMAIRRMSDIDFSAQLLNYVREGIVSDTPKNMNFVFDSHNDVYETKIRDVKRAKHLLNVIDELFVNDSIKEFFTSPVHLFSLFAAIDASDEKEPTRLTKNLERFVNDYVSQDFGLENVATNLKDYKQGASYGTKSKKGRQNRIYALLNYLDD